MIEYEGQGCVVCNRERSGTRGSRELRIRRRWFEDFDRHARARERIYERVGSIYGPATDKKQRRPGRGRIEKQPRESFGTWEVLVFFSFSRVYQEMARCRERVSE